MVKIKENTDLNKVFLESNEIAKEEVNNIIINENKIEKKEDNNIITADYEFETPLMKGVLNHKILPKILNSITKLNFDLIANEKGSTSDLENIKEKDQCANEGEKITIIIQNLLAVSNFINFPIVVEHGTTYMYNGNYYEILYDELVQTFLSEVAYKTGVRKWTARSEKFTQSLYQQFSFTSINYSIEETDESVKINLLNGTLCVKDGFYELQKAEKENFFKYQLSFNYDPEAEAPLFKKFLDKVLPDISSQNVLLEYLGYLLTKNMKLEKILILIGSGSNGKSVLFDIINALFGIENVGTMSMEKILESNGYSIPNLAKYVVNYTSEFSGRLSETGMQLFKRLASGEPVDGRHPFGRPLEVRKYCKFIINSNNLANVEHNHAFFRRQLLIPFKVTITESEKDIHLAKKIIRNELSGILNLILLGLKRLVEQDGFTESLVIDNEIEKYKIDSNTVAQFIEDEGWEKSLVNKIRVVDLYKMYERYCKENNTMVCNGRNFLKRISGLNFTIKTKGTNNYTEVYCQKIDYSSEVIESNNINSILDIFKS